MKIANTNNVQINLDEIGVAGQMLDPVEIDLDGAQGKPGNKSEGKFLKDFRENEYENRCAKYNWG
jgi:hypothetical protein